MNIWYHYPHSDISCNLKLWPSKTFKIAYRWETTSNLDPSKQAQKVLFSNKTMKKNHATFIFNGNKGLKIIFKQPLGKLLDWLNFQSHDLLFWHGVENTFFHYSPLEMLSWETRPILQQNILLFNYPYHPQWHQMSYQNYKVKPF